MDEIVIAVDANVLISSMMSAEGVCRRFLILPLIDDRIKLIISKEVLQEVRGNTSIISRRTGLSAASILEALRELIKDMEEVIISGFDKNYALNFVRDKNDAHIVLLALAGNADYIATYNKRDFKTRNLAPLGIKIRTPAELLIEAGYQWTDLYSTKQKRGLTLSAYKTKLSR